MKEMRELFGEKLVNLGKSNKKMIVLDADLNTSTRTDLFKEELPGQFIQIGIAEQNLFGWAAGLATFGFIPFPTTFAAFAAKRALDQIRVSIAYPGLNVKIPGCYAGISTGKGGASHQVVEDLAVMRAMPNMRVLYAGDGNELMQMMDAIVEYEGPVYFRVLKPALPSIFNEAYKFNWKPVQLRNGKDIALISTGFMTHICIEVADKLEKQGIKATVIHVPCLKPLDPELILKAAVECGSVVTVEDHSIIGGLGGLVSEVLSEECPVYIKRLGFNDTFIESGEDDDLLKKYGLTTDDIIKASVGVLKK